MRIFQRTLRDNKQYQIFLFSLHTSRLKLPESRNTIIIVIKKLSFQMKVMITKGIMYMSHLFFFSKEEVDELHNFFP